MTDSTEIYQHLKEITESKTFSRSNININLLRYLVNASLSNQDIKETTIGNEVFGKDYDPIKNDTKVRVYVYNLRKKLEQFYENEAPNSTLRFVISKGQYKVDFNKATPKKITKRYNKIVWISATLLLFAAISFSILKINSTNLNPFWYENFSNKNSTRLIIGDHFIISGEVPTRSNGMFRDSRINSIQDFNKYIKSHPEKASKLSPTPFAYITKMGVITSSKFSAFFTKNKKDLEISINSEWDNNEINTHNLIYVGQKKNLRFLKPVFMNSNPQYKQIDGSIIRINQLGEEKIYNSHASKPNVDYTIVSKFNHGHNTQISFFLSEHDIGTIKMVEFFTNTDSINKFFRQHDLKNKNFSALFKVTGWNRTGFKKELVAIDTLQQ